MMLTWTLKYQSLYQFDKYVGWITFIVRIFWCIYEGFLFDEAWKIWILEWISWQQFTKNDNTERIKKWECCWNEWKTDSKDADLSLFFGTRTKYMVVAISGKALHIDIMCLDFFEWAKILDLKALLFLRCKNIHKKKSTK